MKRAIPALVVIALATVMSGLAIAQVDLKSGNGKSPSKPKPHSVQSDPRVLGHPLSYWIQAIKDRDGENVDMAFDAIVELGPFAWQAVPELTRVISEPFAPIRPDKDSPAQIYSKIVDIHYRAGAIDSLGAIGEPAAPSAESAIRWGLTIRVLPPEGRIDANPMLIDLIGADILERMRAAGSIAHFGSDAAPAVQKLVESPDNEERKFAAAILSEMTIPIAADLMNSANCANRMRGLSLLSAMWPVVAQSHLETLKGALACSDGDRTKPAPATSQQADRPR